MFTPNATTYGSLATRNTRRRQRTTSTDSVTTRQSPKRRKRSSLAPDTFDTPSSHKSSGATRKYSGSHSKETSPEVRRHREASIDTTTSLAVRSKGNKRGEREKRPTKQGDGIVLTKNDHYIVSKETNIPEALHDVLSKEPWHVQFADSLGHAVALTHTHAIIWRYAQRTTALEPFKPMVVKLPQGAYSTKDLLPNGVLVHDSGVGELALLVVAPTGKIVYWESVSSAANADPIRQKQQGLHGSISGMLSGEVISTVADAEPDGFILTSTAGRAIHISVRDPQGRPAITAQFLRNDNASTGGLFGGIKNVFSSAGWRREIAAVRAGPLRGKNHRQCIVAFSYGVFQIWDLARHSRKTLGYELDSKPQILIATTSVNPALKNGYDFRILDFTLHPHSVDADGEGHRVFALTEFVRNREARYYLLDMTLHDGAPTVSMVHPITCSTSPLKDDKPWPAFKPRVFLPEPGHTAFAIFDDHLIMVSLSKIEESPSSQLQIESHTLSEPFQDILFFAKGSNYHVVGCTVDMLTDKESDKATCLIFANGFGLIRAGAFPAAEGETATERRVSSCRSRIEQAVFFGDKPNNLFEFGLGMGVDDWEDDEVEAAALAVNQSILVCKSRYIPVITPSLETQLKQRAIAMAELIKLVRTRTLKHSTRWELLWSAEKMAAARAFWQVNQEHLKTFKDPEKKTLLWEMIDMLSENYKHENRPNYGETDVVRHYLTYDVADIELVVPWAQNTLQELEKEGVTQPDRRGPFLSQANDIAIMGLQTVFRFREANAELYGLGKDMVDDGVYQGSYEGIKVPWTGIVETVTGMRAHSALCEEFCQEMMGTQDLTEDDDAIDDDLFDKLGKDISDLIHLFCQVSDERLRWLKVQPDPIDQDEYKNLALMYPEARKDLIVGLFDLDIYADPITLGERYADMPALAEVLSSGLAVGNERMMIAEDQGEEDDDAAIMVDEYLKKNFTYFKTYGLKWANAWYTKQIQMAEFAPTIPESNRPLLTEFLQSNPNYAKLAWMREAIHGKDYKRAADTIYSLQKEDSDLWSKRIELSLSKLSLLAAKEKRQVTDEKLAKMSRIISRRIGIIDIQQRLYQYTRPALRNATDRIAELQLAMEEFGVLVKDRPYFFDLLRNNFEKVINTRALEAEDVIDTLTLMNAGSGLVDEDDFAGKRFFYALQILNITGLASTDPDRKELHERVIWRRCLLQDDWTALNRTDAKDDTLVSSEIEQTALFKTLKAGFVDGLLSTDLPPLRPSELYEAGTSINSLRVSSRFTATPDTKLNALATDMKEESKLLQEENRTGRMEMWWAGVVERAKEVVRDEADKRGEEMGRQTELRRDSMKRSRPVVNGVTNGERSVGDSEEEESMSVNDQEEEEDVEMA